MDSTWHSDFEIPRRKSLAGDLRADVAVVGAGMAGVLTALALKEAGCHVAVLEARLIAGGQTGGTSAKLTSQHGLIYSRLIKSLGPERARLYAEANESALTAYRELIFSHGIDCDYSERDAYLYGSDDKALAREAGASCSLGLPASFVRELPIPLDAEGAVRFEGQAQFHPLKFIRAVSEDLDIYENTPVLTAGGNRLETPNGVVTAEHIVFASHYPFVNFPGMFFAKMHQERSYVLALVFKLE